MTKQILLEIKAAFEQLSVPEKEALFLWFLEKEFKKAREKIENTS